MKKRYILLIFLIVSIAHTVTATTSGSVILLAVTEGENSTGVTAGLDLTIDKGTGEVYLNTYPLTKISTQLSLRVAKEQACEELEVDCSQYNFYYTIRSPPGIVGGPSAGAATALLTAQLLQNKTPTTSIAVTGSINSGGIIGPVGGYKEKIIAAGRMGIKKVMVPKGTIQQENLTQTMQETGVQIVEVGTLRQLMLNTTTYTPTRTTNALIIPGSYATSMSTVAENLCNDTNEPINRTRMTELIRDGKYYSAASTCFREIIVIESKRLENSSEQERRQLREKLLIDAKNIIDEVKKDIPKTYADLQSNIAVEERATEVLKELSNENVEAEKMAYLQERVRSAHAWKNLRDGAGKELTISQGKIKESCEIKMGEAEELYAYLTSFYPGAAERSKDTLERADQNKKTGEYTLCIFNSIKAKAELNTVLTSIGLTQESVKDVYKDKLEFGREQVLKAIQRGYFPTLGYSYYEYAETLKDEPEIALLYAEYALEYSKIDKVLNGGERLKSVATGTSLGVNNNGNMTRFNDKTVFFIVLSILVGICIGYFVTRR